MREWIFPILAALFLLTGFTFSVQAEEPLAFSMNLPFVPANTHPEMMDYINETYNVNIKWISLPGESYFDDYDNRLKLLMGDYNTMPDVIYFTMENCSNDFVEWIDAGLLVDLAPYIKDMSNLVRYYEKEYNLEPYESFFNTEDGTMYAIPADASEYASEPEI